ncbi:hypothetical protein CPB84DRAFT_1851684 [Gymnopilus junonius]|uniref:Uncharacterized protein n=1 Tax=Gymnopilus junonius TaxID=109634 RepID=A0A9P5NE84_GYMJU|nr:hypothetical protein CPB84DRAFT_1851684 [Gymnopilus junonius]
MPQRLLCRLGHVSFRANGIRSVAAHGLTWAQWQITDLSLIISLPGFDSKRYSQIILAMPRGRLAWRPSARIIQVHLPNLHSGGYHVDEMGERDGSESILRTDAIKVPLLLHGLRYRLHPVHPLLPVLKPLHLRTEEIPEAHDQNDALEEYPKTLTSMRDALTINRADGITTTPANAHPLIAPSSRELAGPAVSSPQMTAITGLPEVTHIASPTHSKPPRRHMAERTPVSFGPPPLIHDLFHTLASPCPRCSKFTPSSRLMGIQPSPVDR